jgi:hypothetical protein
VSYAYQLTYLLKKETATSTGNSRTWGCQAYVDINGPIGCGRAFPKLRGALSSVYHNYNAKGACSTISKVDIPAV